jgi:hypothetical protein
MSSVLSPLPRMSTESDRATHAGRATATDAFTVAQRGSSRAGESFPQLDEQEAPDLKAKGLLVRMVALEGSNL